MIPTEKIKEIEKEIEDFERAEEESPLSLAEQEVYVNLKAKLSILKEWEEEDKRKVEELKKRILAKNFRIDNDGFVIDTDKIAIENVLKEIDEIFSPQEDGK